MKVGRHVRYRTGDVDERIAAGRTASIDKRPNGKWRARYRVHPGGPQRSKHFDRKADAERFVTRVQGQVLDGSYVDPAAGRVTFEDCADSWRKAQVHRRSTVVQVDAHLRNHMLPTVEQVEAVIAEMPDRYRALVTLAAGTGLRQGGRPSEHVQHPWQHQWRICNRWTR